MKKTIIIAIAMTMVMTLVGCGEKGEPKVESRTIDEYFYTENIEVEFIEEETIEEETIEENYHYDISKKELDELVEDYKDGKISKEYLEEMLYNCRTR